MSERSTQPATVRIRVNHSRTQKEGWRHETTVEFTGPLLTDHEGFLTRDASGDVVPLGMVLGELLTEADTIGRLESTRRTALDQEPV